MEKIFKIAVAKGVVHATIIPVIIFVLTNELMSGNWGGVAALGYMFMVAVLYNFVFMEKDISRKAFNIAVQFTLLAPLSFLLVFLFANGLIG